MFWKALQKWKEGLMYKRYLKAFAIQLSSFTYINCNKLPCPKKICKNKEKSMSPYPNLEPDLLSLTREHLYEVKGIYLP